MTHVRVKCPECGKLAWKPSSDSSTMVHASCPKRGTGATRKLPPIYQPVEQK